MKIKLLVVGKTQSADLAGLIDTYTRRVNRYLPFEIEVIPDLKKAGNLPENTLKQKEGLLILDRLRDGDTVFLLDERGKQYGSVEFSKFLQEQMNRGGKQLIFVVGGAYGFDKEVHNSSQGKISLSKMTFSHQMVRLFFVEQLYRGFSILRNEPYHNQ
ncbi:23S rRNA (pseudouridine(1915)-N(3))-methyltransferase RlmH [Lentiprolixibacter aurantiacus]|uniref:Ribosomal RNA large subunit methyltransferase H n=1 Tax=Lentiprolixibacter aurantiacus TaxID=2993939 RepID=A0AAE3MLW8_9FLAO|nr:23S rRNA (pseudouridine(1915)-N(3))-methyltransferase RlmH [Lentiprolixibacter aurantiacus]MCX2720200.1 23S rRNA (pseudouridine(1915)-N(3))-methyltransferase RlmH [Lentiprolixibacter aurantiacus]